MQKLLGDGGEVALEKLTGKQKKRMRMRMRER